MTVWSQVARRAAGSSAVESGTRRWSAGDLLGVVRRAADRFGSGEGPVAIVLPDPLQQLVWALAADCAGRTVAMLDPRWPGQQLAGALAAIRPSTVVQAHGPVAAAGGGVEGRGWIANTSGTSGAPGHLWRDPESWAESFPAFTALVDLRPGDRVLVPGPLSSSLCAFAALHALAAGACAVLLPHWDVGRLPPVDVAHLVPSMLVDLVHRLAADPPRALVVAGATLEPGLEERVRRRWPELRLVQYYGSAEQSFVTARVGGPAGTVGTAFPGVEITIRDDQGKSLPPGHPGLIWTTSPYHADDTCGLLGRATKPVGSFRRASMPDDRLGGVAPRRSSGVTVGDRGVLDGAGVLTLLGRERIVTGGSTVEPGTVEAVLRELPGVREAVVIGLPHARLGELVTAVLDTDTDTDADALRTARAHARARLSPAQRPRRWYTAIPMPRTLSGKPARGEVSVAARAGRLPRLQ